MSQIGDLCKANLAAFGVFRLPPLFSYYISIYIYKSLQQLPYGFFRPWRGVWSGQDRGAESRAADAQRGDRRRARDFPTFSRTCIFFLLTLSLLWSSLFCSSPLWLFPPLLLHVFILLEIWLLTFLRTYSNVIKRNTDSGFNFGSKRPIKNRIRVKIRHGTHQWL